MSTTFLLFFAVFCGLVRGEISTPPNRWIASLKMLMEDCPVRKVKLEDGGSTPSAEFVETLASCARERALMAIDGILGDDVIPLVDGLELVRFRMGGNGAFEKLENGTITYSVRNLLRRVREKGQLVDEEIDWRERLTSRLSRVLRSHLIKIDFERLMRRGGTAVAEEGRAAATVDQRQIESRGKGRRRRRRQMQMMPIIMMGVLLMGSVLIPMGFQFLAVLGGKALILAKMALMLSSIQGLKKIATNGVNYGLYHTPVPEAWHERSTGYHWIPYSYETVHHDSSTAGHLAEAGSYIDSLGTVYARRSAVQPT